MDFEVALKLSSNVLTFQTLTLFLSRHFCLIFSSRIAFPKSKSWSFCRKWKISESLAFTFYFNTSNIFSLTSTSAFRRLEREDFNLTFFSFFSLYIRLILQSASSSATTSPLAAIIFSGSWGI